MVQSPADPLEEHLSCQSLQHLCARGNWEIARRIIPIRAAEGLGNDRRVG
jgi:hypothetical protein